MSATSFTIRFPFSSSANYEAAVEEARKNTSYHVEGDGKKVLHSVAYEGNQVEEMLSLLELVKGWRNRSVLIDGEPVPWKEAFEWTWCYAKRRGAFSPEEYCWGESDYEMNPWGCQRAELPILSYHGLLSYGRFDHFERWVLDTERIKHELQLKLHRVRYCPELDVNEALLQVDEINPIIDPRMNERWEYVERSRETSNGWEAFKTGVMPAPTCSSAKDVLESLKT